MRVAAPQRSTARAASGASDRVAPVALGLAVILIGAKLGGHIAVRLGQVAVLGELIGGIAQILVTRALRLAPASVLAPFDYSSIVLAVAYGYLWFREEPSPAVWYGLPLVIGSGLYILHRERVRARERGLAA